MLWVPRDSLIPDYQIYFHHGGEKNACNWIKGFSLKIQSWGLLLLPIIVLWEKCLCFPWDSKPKIEVEIQFPSKLHCRCSQKIGNFGQQYFYWFADCNRTLVMKTTIFHQKNGMILLEVQPRKGPVCGFFMGPFSLTIPTNVPPADAF